MAVSEVRPALLFSVVVPSRRGDPALRPLLEALAGQSLAAARFETILVFDGVEIPAPRAGEPRAPGVRIERLERRSGPGAARNRGAAVARGEFLAFTEDDCAPDPEWLARAAARLEAEPGLDAVEGATVTPDRRPVRAGRSGELLHLPTNLFVRRELFLRLGGYCEEYFDPQSGAYFREDSDFGFTLEQAGARITLEPGAIVTHPAEHARFLDPLRWAMRYQMDPLLAARHPRPFRERIEVHSFGPFTVRRPVVRACFLHVVALVAAASALLAGLPEVALALALAALAALLVVWGKWRFAPLRLPVVGLVPWVMVRAWVRGWARARRLLDQPSNGGAAR